ncbi:MAG: hypothetical protein PUP91_25865 [Rhizonema sp. PD37]|nr:hypothetical protein [Rhizonema sp. PD37]
MNTIYPKNKKVSFPLAIFLSALLTVPLLNGCGGGGSRTAAPPPVDNASGRTVSNADQPQAKKGLSTGQKVGITLVGAAALYYLYRQHQNAKKEGSQGKYYLSKNGRVYYRDSNGKPVWVQPPQGGIQVPQSEAQQYQGFQGYNGSSGGRTLRDVAPSGGPY